MYKVHRCLNFICYDFVDMQGMVKFFHKDKAYGFITQEDGNDIFFHISGVTRVQADDGYEKPSFYPREGDVVSFEVEDTDRGTKAINIEWDEEATRQNRDESEGGDMGDHASDDMA